MAKETHIVQGVKVSLDPAVFDDCDVQEEIEAGRVIGAIKAVMGEKTYAEAKKALAKDGRTKLSDMASWYAKCAEEFGVAVKN